MEPKLLTAQRFVDCTLGCSYRYVYSDTEYFRPHYHDYYEIFLMLDGNALHKVNGVEIKVSKGCLVFIRPFDIHDYICLGEKGFSMLNITFTAETAESLFAYLGEGFPSAHLLQLPYPPEVHLEKYEFDRFNRRMDSIRAIDPQNRNALRTSLRILLFDIFTRHFSIAEDSGESTPAWLEEMCAAIKKDGNFALGSEYFFSLSDKSREHISRCLKKHTGMTVSEYINALRLNYIANMLRNSNYTITEIIFKSGFNNISWASELFKEKYGLTMSRYRNTTQLRNHTD